jgi:PIN domain nuclease of toxin-antitoxin system
MILLDTHVVYWATSAPQRLSPSARRAIEKQAPSGGLSISSVTLFELAHLMHTRRIRWPGTVGSGLDALLANLRAVVHEITPEIAVVASEFPYAFPGDPMDRLIAATSRVLGIPLVTKDKGILDSPLVETIW